MAEVRLMHFAKTALEVMRELRQQVLQAHLHAAATDDHLCLIRFEDWTFRQAEVCLSEHPDLRAAVRLERVPDRMTFYRFMRRVTHKLIGAVFYIRGRSRENFVHAAASVLFFDSQPSTCQSGTETYRAHTVKYTRTADGRFEALLRRRISPPS